MPHHRRHNRLRRFVAVAGGATATALLLFAGRQATYAGGPLFSRPLGADFSPPPFPLSPPPPFPLSPPRPCLLSPPPRCMEPDLSPPKQGAFPWRLLPLRLRAGSLPRRLLPIRLGSDASPPQRDADAVMLPDSEVIVLDDAEPIAGAGNAMCAFQGGASSPARSLGRLPGSGRHAYLCLMPEQTQSLQPLQGPLLLPSSSDAAATADFSGRTLLDWSDRLVYDSAVLEGGGDVLVFAKGDTCHQAVIEATASDIRCVYRYSSGADGVVASLPAITSAQQVIRCPPPPTSQKSRNRELRVTLAVTGEQPLPSLAVYHPNQGGLSVAPRRNLICACTMVRNISKFLREWVLYHAAVGVDQFILYDNGSTDDC